MSVLLNISKDIYSQMVDKGLFSYTVKINDMMRIFAIFDLLFTFPTLLTSFYGMNIRLPMGDWDSLKPFMIILSIIGGSFVIVYLLIYRSSLNKGV
jgi:Mg2+ and Co2+ transporter CorA